MSSKRSAGYKNSVGASPAPDASGCAKADAGLAAKPAGQPRGENTRHRAGPPVGKHSVFVLAKDGKPLTPTTPAMARKLLEAGVAAKCWSKFGTFGIRLLTETRRETPLTALGVDHGTKFEGYSVIVGDENPLNVKLDLPSKKAITKKMESRRVLRRARRARNCRRRPARFNNRKREGFIAPSQAVIVGSRLKVLREFFHLYPITLVGLEDVRFNHAKHRWGTDFSTVEVGKTRISAFLTSQGASVVLYRGFETQAARKKYGYRKTSNKSDDKFTAHCSDSLTLAVDVSIGKMVTPGLFLVVDDTYRYCRRSLHRALPAKGGLRRVYAKGTVAGLRKGLLIGLLNGKTGRLCGEYARGYHFYGSTGVRSTAKRLAWVSSAFIVRSI